MSRTAIEDPTVERVIGDRYLVRRRLGVGATAVVYLVPPRRTLFSIAFKSRMTNADLARLRASLDLVTYFSPKPGVFAASPGLVRLDFWSGLFLEPGAGEDVWVLEARTWGSPVGSLAREWHLRAALAARELDRTVPFPPRAIAPAPEAATVPAGNSCTGRLRGP